MDMPVAKTYAKMEICGEPFKEKGRMYVNVNTSKGIKKVRWYSEAEYIRMYPEEKNTRDPMNFNAKHAFGFDTTGYITLYKGRNVEEWAENDRHNIFRNLTFGYYTPGRLELPVICEGIEPIRLMWDEVAAEGNRMKPHEEVQKIVMNLLVGESASKYQGVINEWLQKTVTIREKKSNETHFGTKHTFTMEDAEGNSYIWETGAKDYTCGQTVSLKMKVKEHKEVRGEKITVVWYCKEV